MQRDGRRQELQDAYGRYFVASFNRQTSTKVTIEPGRRPLAYLCYYGKPRLCINIHHYAVYAPPTGCSVTHRIATSLAAGGRCGVSEGSLSSFRSIT